MTTRTLTPRQMSTMPLDALIAHNRRHWPEGAAECPHCEGAGELTHAFRNGMPHTDRCLICFGRGYVKCGRCADTGYYEEYDAEHGEYAPGLHPCDCATGTRMAELDRIDAEKREWEATRPDYDAACHERVAAGNTPF